MSDRIAVMSQGRVEQIATPEELYGRPSSPFVATFVGANNVLHGRVTSAVNGHLAVESPLGPLLASRSDGLAAGQEALIFVRPERIRLDPPPNVENRIAGKVVRRELEGAYLHLEIATQSGQRLFAQVTNADESVARRIGETLDVGFNAVDAQALSPGPLAAER